MLINRNGFVNFTIIFANTYILYNFAAENKNSHDYGPWTVDAISSIGADNDFVFRTLGLEIPSVGIRDITPGDCFRHTDIRT